MPNFDDMSLLELKELAKENNIKNISKLKKEELITILKQVINYEENSNDDLDNSNYDNDFAEEIGKKEIIERKYDKNGEPIVDYKLTNETDEITEIPDDKPSNPSIKLMELVIPATQMIVNKTEIISLWITMPNGK